MKKLYISLVSILIFAACSKLEDTITPEIVTGTMFSATKTTTNYVYIPVNETKKSYKIIIQQIKRGNNTAEKIIPYQDQMIYETDSTGFYYAPNVSDKSIHYIADNAPATDVKLCTSNEQIYFILPTANYIFYMGLRNVYMYSRSNNQTTQLNINTTSRTLAFNNNKLYYYRTDGFICSYDVNTAAIKELYSFANIPNAFVSDATVINNTLLFSINENGLYAMPLETNIPKVLINNGIRRNSIAGDAYVIFDKTIYLIGRFGAITSSYTENRIMHIYTIPIDGSTPQEAISFTDKEYNIIGFNAIIKQNNNYLVYTNEKILTIPFKK